MFEKTDLFNLTNITCYIYIIIICCHFAFPFAYTWVIRSCEKRSKVKFSKDFNWVLCNRYVCSYSLFRSRFGSCKYADWRAIERSHERSEFLLHFRAIDLWKHEQQQQTYDVFDVVDYGMCKERVDFTNVIRGFYFCGKSHDKVDYLIFVMFLCIYHNVLWLPWEEIADVLKMNYRLLHCL